MAKKVSAYNKHVGREMKAGKTMKQAAASWRAGAKSSPTRKTNMAKNKKGGGRKGSRIIGSAGLKGLLTGGAALLLADRVVPNVGGVYSGAIKEVAAGVAGKMVGVGGATLITSGAMKAAAIALSGILSGGLGALGGAAAQTNGGYDY